MAYKYLPLGRCWTRCHIFLSRQGEPGLTARRSKIVLHCDNFRCLTRPERSSGGGAAFHPLGPGV